MKDTNLPAIFNKKHKFIFLILISLVGFFIYANVLKGDFIWDDHIIIKDNVYIKTFAHIDKIFTTDLGEGVGVRFNFYRPLQILSHAIEYHFWKLDVFGYHLVNIFLHLGVGFLLYLLVKLVFKDELTALLCSLLFVIHPVHTGTVAYISNRSELLAAFFIVLTLILYILSLSPKKSFFSFTAFIAFTLAVFSKENALILPFIIAIYNLVFLKKLKIKKILPFAGVVIFYIIFRLLFAQTSVSSISALLQFPNRIPGFFAAIAGYLRLLVFPFGLHMEYGNPLFVWSDLKVITGISASAGLLAWVFKRRKTNSLVFFSSLWFFIMLIPVSGIYPLPFYMSEHYLYLPSIGFFLIAANILSLMFKNKKTSKFAAFLVILLIIGYSYLTKNQTNYWLEPIAFYQKTLEYEPNNSRIYHNLGDVYQERKSYGQAIKNYNKAIELDPQHADSYTNLGVALRATGDIQQAISLFEKAIEIDKDYLDAYNNLGIAYQDSKDFAQAISYYKKALKINPDYLKAYFNLGIAYDSLGKEEEALAVYKQVLKLDPEFSRAHNNLGNVFLRQGKVDRAVGSYILALKYDPGYGQAHFNLGLAYAAMNMPDKAIEAFSKASEFDIIKGDALYNLGMIYKNRGQFERAESAFMQSIEASPRADAYNNLGLVFLATDDSEQATGAFSKAVEIFEAAGDLSSAYHDSLNNLGATYTLKKEYDRAINQYQKVLGIDPEHAMAHNNLAVAYFYKGNYAFAFVHSKEAARFGYEVNQEFLKLLDEKLD